MGTKKNNKKKALSTEDAKAYCHHLGIPYWRERKAYPKPKDVKKIKDEEWRWEFLRRDWDYRDAWHKLCCGEFDAVLAEDIVEYGLVELQDPQKSYEQLDREIVFQQYPAIIGVDDINEWGYYDINEEQDERIWEILHEESEKQLIEVKLNLARPLSPQINKLNTLLEKKQKAVLGKTLRQRVADNPVQYLRAYDAILVGVDNTTIGTEIFGCTTKPSAATRGRQARKKLKKLWQNF